MRLKRNLLVAGIGAALVWFTHPTEGPRRRRQARRSTERAVEEARAKVPDSVAERLPDAMTDGGSDGHASAPAADAPASDRHARSASTLMEVVAAAKDAGYHAEFTTTAASLVRCSVCDTESRPDALTREWMHRLEGASDPDDMLSVSALRCPACDAAGVLVLPYGPSADQVEATVARDLPPPARQDMAPVGPA